MKNLGYNEQEYITLRDEIVKRIEIRQQLIYTSLTFAGVIMGFGINTSDLSFIYPPLAFSFTLMWAQNDLRSLQISDYLQSFENEVSNLGWIKYYKSIQGKSSFKLGWPISVVAPGSLFLITSIMCIGIGLNSFKGSIFSWSLLILDIFSTVGIFCFIIVTKKQRISRRLKKRTK